MIEKDLLLDKRIVDRNVTKGYIKKEDITNALGSLKDLKDKFETVEVAIQAGEFDLTFYDAAEEQRQDEEENEENANG